MSLSLLLMLIAVGIVSGAVAGLLGVGGAIIMVPAMVFFAGLSQVDAQGTSLAVLLPPIGIIAVYNYYKAGHVNIKFALILAATFLIGSYFGSKFALTIPQNVLKKIFAILLILVAARMLLTK